MCRKKTLAIYLAAATLALTVVVWGSHSSQIAAAAPKKSEEPKVRLEDIPFDGKEAFQFLKQICDCGPRPSGSPGMAAQWQLLASGFQKLGARVTPQAFRAKSPLADKEIDMANMIVEWHPDRKDRILICTHYDSRPYPDKDPRNPQGKFIGANSASGVAVLMELARWMPTLESKYGVDFVLFDATDLVVTERTKKTAGDPHFIGSDFFAHSYVDNPPAYKYHYAVDLELVGGENLQIYQEFTSMSWSDSRPTVQDIWRVAYKCGVREFISDRKSDFGADHEKLHAIAKIPSCCIVDVDYPQWRTERDALEHCSPLSLAKVGWVVLEWLKQVK